MSNRIKKSEKPQNFIDNMDLSKLLINIKPIYDCKERLKTSCASIKEFLAKCIVNLKITILYIIFKVKDDIVSFFKGTLRFLKFITWPFRKALYEYVFITFFACLFISLKYPAWFYADYIWVLFFFVVMTVLAVATIREK